ncbi:MAG: PorP/SprF family type IX secretion system membrane protein [Bacteroidota bacterium]
MKKTTLSLIIFLCLSSNLWGQQESIYANYQNNPLLINPAYTGLNNSLSLNLNYRAQWTSLDEAPQTAVFSAHTSFAQNRFGGGIMIINDRLGVTDITEVNLSYAYKLELGNGAKLAMGLQFGLQDYRDDFNDLDFFDGERDVLFMQNESFTQFNFGTGLIFTTPNLFLGFSIPRLLEQDIEASQMEATVFNRHYYASAAYLFSGLYPFELKPAVVYRGIPGAPASLDYSFTTIYKEVFQFGVLSRNFNTYGLQAGIAWKDNFRFGYTFEVPTNNNSVGSNFTTHEVSIQANFAVLTFQGLQRIIF